MYGPKPGLLSLLSKHTIIPRQKRPLSHDLTASFRSVYNTEPKATVICSAFVAENLGRRKFLRNRI